MSKLPEWVGVGAVFHVEVLKGNRDVWGVRGIVDDQAVCRRWIRIKQRWQYEIFCEAFFEVNAPYIKAIRCAD